MVRKLNKISEKKQVEFDILCLSLIGKEIEIVGAKNKLQIGVKGNLIFESANLFYIKVDNIMKKYLKSGLIIKFDYNNEDVIVDCSILLGSLVSRIKKIK